MNGTAQHRCPGCKGPITFTADDSDGITVDFHCSNESCESGKHEGMGNGMMKFDLYVTPAPNTRGQVVATFDTLVEARKAARPTLRAIWSAAAETTGNRASMGIWQHLAGETGTLLWMYEPARRRDAIVECKAL